MNLEKIDREVLKRYVEMRQEVTKRVDRVVAVSHLLSLLKGCDGMIKVDAGTMAEVGDQIDDNVCGIQELLDDFIYLVDAEEVLAG